MENHLEAQHKIHPFCCVRNVFYFWAKVLCTWNTRHAHIHNTCNPEISLKTKCQSNFSSWGSAVMASDKVIQAWYIVQTSDLSWQPAAVLALLLWASVDRRTQASLESFQSYTTQGFPRPLAILELPIFLVCIVCKSAFSLCLVWILPCKLIYSSEILTCHKDTSSASAVSAIAHHSSLSPDTSSFPLQKCLWQNSSKNNFD